MRQQYDLPKYIPQLDGLRAIAVLLVMFNHFAVRLSFVEFDVLARYGWTGVDLFFVLSGFLITRVLLDSKGSGGYFKNFYARRALRIWPVYYALLLFVFLLFPLVVAHSTFLRSSYVAPESGAWIYFAAFLQNFWMPVRGFLPVLAVTWSLAVEEQFYIVWPWLVLLLNQRTLKKILVVALVFSPLARAVAIYLGASGYQVYCFTVFRLDGLIIGALIAIWVRSPSFSLQKLWSVSAPIFVVGVVGAIWLTPESQEMITGTPVRALAYSSLAVFFGAMLCLCLTVKQGSMTYRFLTCRPMKYTGKVSYCLYLIHLPVFTLLNSNAFQRRVHFNSPAITDAVVLLIGFATVYGIATLSWYGLETRVLALKSHFENRKTEVTVAEQPAAACAVEA